MTGERFAWAGAQRATRMKRRCALAIVASLFLVSGSAMAQAIVHPPVRIIPPTVGPLTAPLLPAGPYRLTLTVPPSAGAPPITRHVRGTLAHAGDAITLHLEHSLTLNGTLNGDRLDLRTADTRGDTLALALTATGSHAVGTVVIASNAQRATGTTILEPAPPAGGHEGGAATARNRDADGTCGNVITCLIRDLFGIVINLDP